MLNKIYSCFRKCPDCVRKLMYLIPIEKRLGGETFIRRLDSINRTERLSKEQLIKLQERELSGLLNHAVEHIPFYQDIRFNHSGDAFDNLTKFPVIDKDTILNDITQFVDTRVPAHKRYYVTTGGTSGNCLGFYLDNSTYGQEWAYIVSLWKRANYQFGDRVATLRGVECGAKRPDRHWQLNPQYNALEFSPFDMSPANMPAYLRELKRWNPSYILGYPSAVAILAKYLNANGNDSLPPIKAVLAASENVYPDQVAFIEESLSTRMFSWYGQSEKVILAGECEHSHRYHIFPQYGVTEVIGSDSGVIPWENTGERGELVGTGFMNRVMPFIRYKTEDFATIAGWGCPACGREYPLIEDVRGRRTQDMIVGKDGALISMTAVNMHSDVFDNVERLQFYQEKEGKLILNIVKTRNFSESDTTKIHTAIQRKMGQNMEVTFRFVDEIPLSRRGKYRYLIQKLPVASRRDR